MIRDGVTFFRNAIQKAHSEAIQVANRFHVLQVLTRHAQKDVRALLLRKLVDAIPKSRQKELTVSQKQKDKLITSVRKLRTKGYTFSAIARQLDIDYRIVKRYIDLTIDCLED